MAGDSDSSALTQESGDEGEAGAEGSRLGSVVTGTDGGTEEPEGEEEEEGACLECLTYTILLTRLASSRANKRQKEGQESHRNSYADTSFFGVYKTCAEEEETWVDG